MVSTDKKPWVAWRWEDTCVHGVATITLEWDLAPVAYGVSLASSVTDGTGQWSRGGEGAGSQTAAGSHASEIPNLQWTECLDVAKQATQGRVDLFQNDCTATMVNWLNISIQHPGSWTAPSLSEVTVTCKPGALPIRPDNNGPTHAVSADLLYEHSFNAFRSGRLNEGERKEDQKRNNRQTTEKQTGQTGQTEFDSARKALNATVNNMKRSNHSRDYTTAITAFALQVLIGQQALPPLPPPQQSVFDADGSVAQQQLQRQQLQEDQENAESGAFLAMAHHHYLGSPAEYMERLLR